MFRRFRSPRLPGGSDRRLASSAPQRERLHAVAVLHCLATSSPQPSPTLSNRKDSLTLRGHGRSVLVRGPSLRRVVPAARDRLLDQRLYLPFTVRDDPLQRTSLSTSWEQISNESVYPSWTRASPPPPRERDP